MMFTARVLMKFLGVLAGGEKCVAAQPVPESSIGVAASRGGCGAATGRVWKHLSPGV